MESGCSGTYFYGSQSRIMKPLSLSFTGVVVRFYLMMVIVLVAGFIGQWWLSVLAFPVFLSGLIGLVLKNKSKSTARQTSEKVKNEKVSTKETLVH